MKKFLWHSLAVIAAVFAIVSCKDPIEPDDSIATLSPADLVTVAANAYATWENDNVIPETLKVGDVELTLPQYQYALCKLLSFVATGDKSEIKVYNYKPAEHPDRDSYDKDEIAVVNGPKINEGTEDIADIAKRMMNAMEDKLQVPNQTLITRTGSSALAFSTNRATVTMLRTLAAYKKDGRLPEKAQAPMPPVEDIPDELPNEPREEALPAEEPEEEPEEPEEEPEEPEEEPEDEE